MAQVLGVEEVRGDVYYNIMVCYRASLLGTDYGTFLAKGYAADINNVMTASNSFLLPQAIESVYANSNPNYGKEVNNISDLDKNSKYDKMEYESIYGLEQGPYALSWIVRNKGPGERLELSTRFLNKNDQLWKNADNIKPIDGYQDIVCHGDQYSFVFKNADGVEVNVSVKEFAEILQDSPVYDGGPIRLISCETGAEGAITAQYLANYLDVEVIAPTDIVYVYPDGDMIIGLENLGFWKTFKPRGD